MCNNDNAILISLQKDEVYHLSMGDKRGLEIQFSLLNHRAQ
jgi:hypothetical protein